MTAMNSALSSFNEQIPMFKSATVNENVTFTTTPSGLLYVTELTREPFMS